MSAASGPGARRGVLAVGASRIGYEVKGYFRSPDAVFFTFLFPLIMLGIFTAAFSASGDISAGPGTESISVGAYYLPGMLAAGMLLSGVQNLAVDIATEKGDGTLKRLGGTPLSPVSYFLGKIGHVFVTGVLQAALLLLVAATVFGIALPTEPQAWGTFAWVFVLGVGTSALLGIALSSVPRSGKSATAVVIPIVLVLQFISGVYIQFSQLPEWMQNIASVFPLKWMAQGMRAAFLPDDFKVMEQNQEWDLGWVAVALLAWLVIGLVVSRLTFRWNRRDA
ncbi:ABC transporter permease [Agromyces tardus]|uniref:ABC transporter permease n=2 Tax=Agromyces tardus TaxID=2583849 RepID=A0A3M7ZXM6_9MICO|nr:ABC transporter permease [Agromyces tardus]RNB43734.1 ABC transporter permease [Agromyces tardus]